MKFAYLILFAALALAGCGNGGVSDLPAPDQCLRAKLFKECLAAVPKGPETTVYNDWAEVVDECASAATYQSYRRLSQISMECRP